MEAKAREVRIPPIGLAGILQVPKNAYALVVFVHGSGSSRLSPRNVLVARALNDRGIATLLFDLLTPAEEIDRVNVFNIALLTSRLVDVIGWLDSQPAAGKATSWAVRRQHRGGGCVGRSGKAATPRRRSNLAGWTPRPSRGRAGRSVCAGPTYRRWG